MKTKMKLKTNIHASVDESFEELEQLAAVAGSEEAEDLDTDEDSEDDTESDDDGDDDVTDEDSEDGDSEYSDDESEDEDEDEDDTESNDGEEADSDEDYESEDEDTDVDEDSDVDADAEEFETESDDDDTDSDDDECDSEDDDMDSEDDDMDSEDDTESDDEDTDSEEMDSSDDEEVDEDAVLASLAEAGMLVVISTTDNISEKALGIAVAALEDEEFGDDVDVDVEADADDEADFEDDVDVDVEASEEDMSDDEEADSEEDTDVADDDTDSEDDVSDDESEDESEDDTDTDEEYSDEDGEGDDTDSEDSDEEAESDTDEDLDEDRLAPVASREMLARSSVEDVEFVLHNAKSNPVWNVIVAGVPAARLALSSYGDGAEEVRSFFTTKQFVDGVKRAMASEGVLSLLDKSNAEYYANAFKSGDVFAEARAHAERIGNQKVTAAVSGVREDFVDALKIAAAGMDKNFFQKPNHLKRELFMALSHAGVAQPQALIESAFAAASAQYFETLAETAEEFLDMPTDARDTLRATIEGSGVIDRAGSVEANVHPAQATTASALDLIREMRATASTDVATVGSMTGSRNERRDAIRNLF